MITVYHLTIAKKRHDYEKSRSFHEKQKDRQYEARFYMEIRYYKLHKLLKEKNISLNKLQKTLNLLPSEIEKITTNRLLLSDTYILICQHLNCDISDIMDVLSLKDEQEPFVDIKLITKNSYKTKLNFD